MLLLCLQLYLPTTWKYEERGYLIYKVPYPANPTKTYYHFGANTCM